MADEEDLPAGGVVPGRLHMHLGDEGTGCVEIGHPPGLRRLGDGPGASVGGEDHGPVIRAFL